MSSQVPLWVTVAVALVGFVGVLSAQFIAAWREDRRWRREQEREELRWQRERTRELENRDYDARKEAYAQIIAAVEGFDWLVYPALMDLRHAVTELNEDHRPDVRRARDEIRLALGPVNLQTPHRFNELVRGAVLPRSNLAMYLLGDKRGREKAEEFWAEGQLAYRRMRAQMRADLGLDAEDLPETAG